MSLLGGLFQFSSVSTRAADMSARILGKNNDVTRSMMHGPGLASSAYTGKVRTALATSKGSTPRQIQD